MFSDKATENSDLWNRIRAGERNALACLYNIHVGSLYNYGNKIARSSIIVEDAIQDLFIDLWNYRKNLGIANSVRSYLYASLRRKIIKSMQESHEFCSDYQWDDMHLMVDSEEDKIIAREYTDEKVARLRASLNNLSPRQYEAIVLRFYNKLSYLEIAEVMDVNEQSVRNLIQRGIESLRQHSQLIVSLLLFVLPYFF